MSEGRARYLSNAILRIGGGGSFNGALEFYPHEIELTWLLLPIPIAGWAWISRKTPRRRSKLGAAFTNFARRRTLAVASVGLLALALRAALLPLHPVPQPGIVDEFSYQLAADTFASGRIANPSHPLWICFESPMILSRPTYVSKYPPAQGLVLAAGILLARNPWVGVWLSVGAMCSAIVWMLQGWIPPRWALLGGLLAIVRIGAGSYWIDSYWGGAVAAAGGALLYGSLPRLMRHGRIRDGLLFGVGLAVLANSRPYEGLLAALPAVLTLAAWTYRRGRGALRPILAVFLLLLLTAAAMLGYNARTTGNPLLMPYQLHEAQYSGTPMFWFLKLTPLPVYRHAAIEDFHKWERDVYLANSTKRLFWASLQKLDKLRSFFLGSLLTVCLLALPWALRAKRLRPAFLGLGMVLAGMLLLIDVVPHYAAPITGNLYLLAVQCLRWMRASGKIGLMAGRAIPVLLAATLVVFYVSEAAGAQFLHELYSWCFARPGYFPRARILDRLNRTEGQHLVLVRYQNSGEFPAPWVYNRADIDSAKVVWAWESEPACDRSLIRYFRSRHVWRLDTSAPNPDVEPYPTSP
jgi:hypothetical protein